MKTIIHFEFSTPEEAIEALARLRGTFPRPIPIPPPISDTVAGAAEPPKPAGRGAASRSSAATSPSAAQGQASAATSPPPPPPPAPSAPPTTALPAADATAVAPPLKTLVDLVLRGATEKRPQTVAVLAKYKAMKASQVAEADRANCIEDLVAVLNATDDSLTG